LGLLDFFTEKVDADTLYFSLTELPNPRNAAVFTICHGKTVIATSHLSTDTKGIEAACRVVAYHRATIKRSGYKKIVHENLSEWAQCMLEAELK